MPTDRQRQLGILALDHVQLTVPPELEEDTIRFYGEVLKLQATPKPHALLHNRGAWFQIGQQQLHLSPEAIRKEHLLASKRHICFSVTSLDSVIQLLEEQGMEIIPDKQPIPGVRRIYVRDPAGNRVEFAEMEGPVGKVE